MRGKEIVRCCLGWVYGSGLALFCSLGRVVVREVARELESWYSFGIGWKDEDWDAFS